MSDIAKKAGVSRQALYLHFKTRAELYIATTQIGKFVSAWAGHMENIQHVARALLAAGVTDVQAMEAWNQRMGLLYRQCFDISKGLKAANMLRSGLSIKRAAELFVVTISFQNWDRMRHFYGWSKAAYIELVTAQVIAGIVTQK